MFTKKQVKILINNFIFPIFSSAAQTMGENGSQYSLVEGHCFYFASKLTDLLQGEYRNVDIDSLSDEEKIERKHKVGRIVSQTFEHYFVEYNDEYYDGLGAIIHYDDTIVLGEREGVYSHSGSGIEKISKYNLYYQGTDKGYDAYAYLTMEKWKDAIWDAYDIGVNPILNEFLDKIEAIAKNDNEEEFKKIVSLYTTKAMATIYNENRVKKKDDGYDVGKVAEIKLKLYNRTPEEHLRILNDIKKDL